MNSISLEPMSEAAYQDACQKLKSNPRMVALMREAQRRATNPDTPLILKGIAALASEILD